MKTIEEITEMLINGLISSAEADKMCGGKKLKPLEFYDEKVIPQVKFSLEDLTQDRDDAIEQAPLQYRDSDDCPKSEIRYSVIKDSEEGMYLFIKKADAFEEGKGYFSKVFRQLVDVAFENNIYSIRLEVEEGKNHAMEVYNHLGFISLGRSFNKPNYFDMKKDLVSE